MVWKMSLYFFLSQAFSICFTFVANIPTKGAIIPAYCAWVQRQSRAEPHPIAPLRELGRTGGSWGQPQQWSPP